MTMRNHRLDRRALFTSGAAAALLAAAGVSAQAEPRRGGRLRMALSGAARSDSFDTRQPMGLFMQAAVAGAVFDTLTEVAADGTLRAELATGWTGSPDARSWEFELRPGVRFHNGAAFAARDVAASLDLHRGAGLSAIRGIGLPGGHRIRIDLADPDPDFPYLLSALPFAIYPSAQIEQAMREGIGTGLYRVHRFQPGRQFIGARVAEHYKDGRAGWFDTVELVSIPAAHVRAQALRERLVDAADLDDPGGLADAPDIALLPDARAMTQAVRRAVAVPQVVGSLLPLDNLRAAERWWMA